jgi:hypothetical protein
MTKISVPSDTRTCLDVGPPLYRDEGCHCSSQIKGMLRQRASRPLCLGVKPETRFLLLSDSRGFVDTERPHWSKDRPAGLASAIILGSESRGIHDHISLSQIRDYPNPEGHVPVFIPPKDRVPGYSPGTGFPFSSPPTTHRTTAEIFEPATSVGPRHIISTLIAQKTPRPLHLRRYSLYCRG